MKNTEFIISDKVTKIIIDKNQPDLDSGQIIVQEQFSILADDTAESLEEKAHEIEHRLYPKAISQVLQG